MKDWMKIFAAGVFSLIFVLPGFAAQKFRLKNGDRVLFYGDSITEQRYWTVAVETYVRTRFPDLKVKFLNSAVGGDRVIGGWAGPIDQRLERDVFPFKPNIVTIMLGMNDGTYRPWEDSVAKIYEDGYRHIIESLQSHLPGVKIVLIQPTPWDDITQTPSYPYNPTHAAGGYDNVMQRYSEFVKKLGEEDHLEVVDFHTPLVDLMKQAKEQDPSLAGKIIPGRVHPGASTELVMAQALLKAWGAPATVSDVSIDAANSSVSKSEMAKVSGVASANGGLAWTETDEALPYPIMTLHAAEEVPRPRGFGPRPVTWEQFPPDPWGQSNVIFWKLPPLESSEVNPVAALVTKISGMYPALDEETLRVTGLSGNSYQLKIDGKTVGTFSKDQLESGINLAKYDTPMMEQADKVLTLVWHRVDVRFYGWRAIMIPLKADMSGDVQNAVTNLIGALDAEQDNLISLAHQEAQPEAHHYELTPAN